MSEDINYRSNPLHGLSLKNLLTELVEHYDFDILYAYLNINCFKMNPSVESSVKFLKKTEWAREKIESFYLYQYKNLPSPSDEQFALPPRDRIIPDDQIPGEPMLLSIEDAERVREKQAKRAAKLMPRRSKASGRNASGARSHDANARRGYDASSDTRGERERTDTPHEDSNESSPSADPWSKWR